MSNGLLLEFLTELGSGTWDEFRNAWSACEPAEDQRPSWALQNLAALGHIDVDPAGFSSPKATAWRVCPPLLAGLAETADRKTQVVLCGGRTEAFVSRVMREAKQRGGVAEWTFQANLVAAVRLQLPLGSELGELADAIGIPFIPEAGRRLALCLPTIDVVVSRFSSEPEPSGPGLQKLDTSIQHRRPAWISVAAADTDGAYRQEWLRSTQYWVKQQSVCKRVRGDQSTAVYAVAKGLLLYQRDSSKIRFRVRPPSLYLRALVLCSGILPNHNGLGEAELGDIPPDVAEIVIERLKQGKLQYPSLLKIWRQGPNGRIAQANEANLRDSGNA